jgi:hypothetical protein
MSCIYILKGIIRIICGVAATSSYRNLFNNQIYYLYHVSIFFKLMVFVIDNQKNYQTKLSVHGLDTRNKNHLYLPIENLSSFQRVDSSCAMKIINSFPNNVKNLRNDKLKFKIDA